MGAGQPLWVDELHSSWLLSAQDCQQLSARAAMGNQSPYYFYLVALLGWTVEFPPASPWVMRLPAMLAWSTSVGLCVWIVLAFPTSHQPECVSTRFQFSTRFLRHLDANAFRKIGQPDANAFRLMGQLVCKRLLTAYGIYLPVILWAACIALDRNQGFYAVEARVYSLLQLLSLLAWLIVGRLVEGSPLTLLWFSWCLLCTCLIHLHVTSCLVVATQALVLCWQLGNRQARKCLLLSFGWIGLQMGLVIFNMQPVWQSREQWSAFAGDASIQSMFQILPLTTLVLPVLMAWVVQQFTNQPRPAIIAAGRKPSGARPDHSCPDDSYTSNSCTGNTCTSNSYRTACAVPLQELGTHRSWVTSRPWFWAVAWAGPWLIAALVTRLEIAPVFHYRFIIASALPLYLLIACALQQLTSAGLRTLAITAILLGLLWTQGSLTVWSRGGCYLGLRGENWAGAVDYVSENFQPERQSLWCYAGLIEGHHMLWPLTEKQDEYLSFPMRGWHQVASPNSKPVQPHGLTGQFETWGDQIRIQSDSADAVWIVFRGSAGQLQQRLKQAKLDRDAQRHPIREFGRVSVVCIERPLVE